MIRNYNVVSIIIIINTVLNLWTEELNAMAVSTNMRFSSRLLSQNPKRQHTSSRLLTFLQW